jgi:hypothetical protein
MTSLTYLVLDEACELLQDHGTPRVGKGIGLARQLQITICKENTWEVKWPQVTLLLMSSVWIPKT